MQRFLVCGLIGTALLWGADNAASRLARAAESARDSGQVVRAYLLYSEAAAREPHNSTYVSNRDALASAAQLLIKAEVQNADISAEVKRLEAEEEKAHPEPPIEIASLGTWRQSPELAPLPHLEPLDKSASFDIRTDERALVEQVTKAYGIKVTFDPQLQPKPDLRFAIDGANFLTAMNALTAVTDTFLFPISRDHVFVARDTEDKRNQFEPEILLSFPLPNALEQKDLNRSGECRS